LPSELVDAVWICGTGAQIYDRGERIFDRTISIESSRRILSWMAAVDPLRLVSVEADDQLFANGPLPGRWPHQVVDLQTMLDRSMSSILINLVEFRERAILHHIVPQDCRLILHNNGTLAQIMPSSVSKVQGLRMVLSSWNISPNRAIVFGDDIPDIEMIQECGIGVAMGNALPGVKEVADLITSSNDEDGVAEVLELLLERGC
jgi:hydroxymethylpyrimidine pyrophosphatase-like HAD family hydrolase